MRKALLVGIDDYGANSLSGCVADAEAIGGLLEVDGDGSPNFSVNLMTSSSTTITRPKLKDAIESLFQGDSEVALLYFSGHGFIDGTGGFLVTSDVEPKDEGVPMDTVLALANNSKARNKIIILDCCNSGAFGTPRVTADRSATLSEGLTILTASRDNESALETNGQGVFTSLLIDALRGGAADLRGNITPGSLYAYVDEALGAWDQRPIFKTNVATFVRIRKIEPKVPTAILRKITEYFPDSAAVHKLDPTYEDTEKGYNKLHASIFKDLQKLESIGIVVPVDEEHMYYAAMNSTGCKLTALGAQYWRLASEGKL